MSGIDRRLAHLIETSGPISVAHYMAEANAHYYGSRDPLGAAGDFTTAPEISQMFGEMVGLWMTDLWQRAGSPPVHYVELGPGRGTLAADALRAMRAAGLQPPVHFVETSPVLREAQETRIPGAEWHDDVSSLPKDRPLLIVANEFFDALPVRQLVATESGWRELLVDHQAGKFVRVPGPTAPAPIAEGEPGTIVETSPASVAIMGDLARHVAKEGGAALIIDYGHLRPGTGDTIQAMKSHAYSDPWAEPGERDLTAHVDFSALRGVAEVQGNLSFVGTQRDWLVAMGISVRAGVLARSAPARSEEVKTALERLTAFDQMGELFKVLAVTNASWPEPAGLK